MSTTPTPLTPAVMAHLGPLFWPEDEVLSAINADLAARGPQIQVAPDEGRLLHLLVTAVGARRVLEVGTLFGYSAVWMARALPPDGHLDTIEISDMHADAAEHWLAQAGLSEQVTVHRGPALEVLPGLAGPYDVAFFDAVKAEYTSYLDHALRTVRSGGLILADNVLWSGRIADPGADDADTAGLRAYLERLASDPDLASTVVAAGDGLSLTIRR